MWNGVYVSANFTQYPTPLLSIACGRPCRGVIMVFAGIVFEMKGKYQHHHREKSVDRKKGEILEKKLVSSV